MNFTVGMGTYVITDREDGILRTFGLASCIAVTAYCPVKKVAGMIHVVLPSPLNEKDKLERPVYFAKTGIPIMIHKICRRYGCKRVDLFIQMFGGADSMVNKDIYMVAKQNIQVAKTCIADMGLAIGNSQLRGNQSRTLEMHVRTGKVKVFSHPFCSNFTC